MSDDIDYYEFPTCMHAMAAAFHRIQINPGECVISIPYHEWWRLWCALDRKMPGMLRFDGRGSMPDGFQYMGFRFQVAR